MTTFPPEKQAKISIKEIMPPFSFDSDAIPLKITDSGAKEINSFIHVPQNTKNVKSFFFVHKQQQYLCVYYEFDSKRNRIEMFKFNPRGQNSLLFSISVNRGFLDPIIVKYCPRMNVFCCLESSSAECHRARHKLVFYLFTSKGLNPLKTITAQFGELFDCFEIISSLQAFAVAGKTSIFFIQLFQSKELASIPISEPISCMKYLPEIELLVCGGNRRIFVYSMQNRSNISLVYQLKGHVDTIMNLCWSPEEKILVSLDSESKIVIWSLEQGLGTNLREIQCEENSYLSGLFYIPEISFILVMKDNLVLFIDSKTGKVRKEYDNIGRLVGLDRASRNMVLWKDSKIYFKRIE